VAFSVPACICLWNSLVLVSQRIDLEKLQGFAAMTLPWVIEWGTESSAGKNHRHPLCVAAAMQVAFVQLTRTKSISFLSERCEDVEKSILKAYRWAFEILRRNDSVLGDSVRQAERSAALKLLAVLISIEAANIEQECGAAGALASVDSAEILETLHVIVNRESDPDLCLLASRVLEGIANSRMR